MLSVIALLNLTGKGMRQATLVAIIVTAMGVLGSVIRERGRPRSDRTWAATKPWIAGLTFWIIVLVVVVLAT